VSGKLLFGQVPAKIIDHNGKTPLHYAAFAGRAGVAKLLLEADPSALAIVSPADGYTPLLDALVSEHAAVSALLIKNSHADLTARDVNGHSVLFHAARFQTASLVRAVLTSKRLTKADVNAAGKRTKFTALHAASLEGQDESVELLLEAGADLHARDMEYSTPLHLVAQREVGGVRVVELLVKAGAEVDARMETENAKSVTALHLAANKGNIGVLEALLEAGASMHAKDKIGRTPLVAAIAKGTAATVALLLKRGASAKEFRSAFNFTALHFAAGQGKQDIVDVLVGPGGMDINTIDNRISRATALHYAAGEGCAPAGRCVAEARGVSEGTIRCCRQG
jgi:ankyrin repeat protein